MQKTKSAGGVVMNRKGEIALVKNGPDFWGFPKGHIDPGEDALTAARREIQEEAGLSKLTLVREFPPYERYRSRSDGSDDFEEFKTIYMFLFTTDEEVLKSQDPGNPEARWATREEVVSTLTNEKDRQFFKAMMPDAATR